MFYNFIILFSVQHFETSVKRGVKKKTLWRNKNYVKITLWRNKKNTKNISSRVLILYLCYYLLKLRACSKVIKEGCDVMSELDGSTALVKTLKTYVGTELHSRDQFGRKEITRYLYYRYNK